MRIGNQTSYNPYYQTRNQVTGKQNNKNFASTMNSSVVGSTKNQNTVFLKNENTIYSGGQAGGLSYKIDYAPQSTDENPIALVTGVDENGNKFEQTLEINKINPENCTMIEFRALEGHLNGGKGATLDSPTGLLNLGLYGDVLNPTVTDKANYIDILLEQSKNFNNSPFMSDKLKGLELNAEIDMWFKYFELKGLDTTIF